MSTEESSAPTPEFQMPPPRPGTVTTSQPTGDLSLPPPTPPAGKVDPDVFAAWKKEVALGFERNNLLFSGILDAFMRPYWMTVRMYQVLFAIGILGFVLSAVLAVWRGLEFGLLFGGISVIAFISYFLSRPLASLEQNLQFITWLGLIYNTYWARLMYANDTKTIQADLESISSKAIADIKELVEKQAELSSRRPDIKES